jgi:hypothetical protein
MCACRSGQTKTEPSIEFSKVPPAMQGGREKVDTISGRVTGARPGQKIVVYARSGPWWVQPWPIEPFIPIQSDSSWSTQTHMGFEYAALLVNPGYLPAPTMDVLPSLGGPIVAIAAVKGVGPIALAPTKLVHFSGYDWKVRTIASDRGGLNNLYDGDNAWTDDSGAMHLRIKKKGERWSCAEVFLTRSLGYGTYMIVANIIVAAMAFCSSFARRPAWKEQWPARLRRRSGRMEPIHVADRSHPNASYTAKVVPAKLPVGVTERASDLVMFCGAACDRVPPENVDIPS